MKKTTRILVVEDRPAVRHTICYVIESINREKIEVLEAENGQEAMEIMNAGIEEEESIDLVVTDLTMPKMNGIDFIKSIRSNEKFNNTSVLLLTGEVGDLLEEAKKSGIDDFVGKPFDHNELEQKIKSLLAKIG